MKNRMEENNHQINNFDKVLDKLFGTEGSQQRAEAENKAYAFYSGQVFI